jgi:hypothetical protein
MQQIATAAMQASGPAGVLFGTVESVAPLKVRVEQKLLLGAAQLILTHSVVDYEVSMTVDHTTEEAAGGSGDGAYEAHQHAYTGKKTFKVHNALKTGDGVILLRLQGGQQFVVLDKAVET